MKIEKNPFITSSQTLLLETPAAVTTFRGTQVPEGYSEGSIVVNVFYENRFGVYALCIVKYRHIINVMFVFIFILVCQMGFR